MANFFALSISTTSFRLLLQTTIISLNRSKHVVITVTSFKSKPPPPKLWPKKLYWFLNHIYQQLRAKVRTNVDSQKLRTNNLALTDAERDLQDSLLTNKKDLHENITAHFDGLYLADHDTYIYRKTS